MEQALRGKPESMQPQPPGLVSVRIDPASGQLARADQNDAIFEIFTEATVPTTIAKGAVAGQEQNSNNLTEADDLF